MMGMVTPTPAAAIEPIGVWNWEAPEKNAIAAGTVWEALVEVSEIAKTKSVQQKMNTRIAVVTMPGAASGAITCRNACMGVAPSTLAAFSSSQGISRKKAERV